MRRIPCCDKDSVRRGQWTPEEDSKLLSYITQHGTRNWRLIPKNAGLQRCGRSCRLRWTNYLRPGLKHGEFTDNDITGSSIPGRTDNDVRNHWNTKLKKKLIGMGIDPVTHKSFSHLMAEIANTLAPPKVAVTAAPVSDPATQAPEGSVQAQDEEARPRRARKPNKMFSGPVWIQQT